MAGVKSELPQSQLKQNGAPSQGGEVVRAGCAMEFEVIDKVPLEVVKAFYVGEEQT